MGNTRGVRGGTPVMTETLCRSCRSAQIVCGYSESEEIIFCSGIVWSEAWRVPFSVSKCSSYDDARITSLMYMEKLGTILTIEADPKSAGYVPVKGTGKMVLTKADDDS